MSDLRKQLRKAGLISEKQLRQAKHKERLRASEAGREGLAQERRAEEDRLRGERDARKKADRGRQEEQRRAQQEAAASQKLERVIRGGSWFHYARDCRSASRGPYWPGSKDDIVGFRVARTIP